MKKIQVTSTGYCEIIQNFIVTDEMYERIASELSALEELEFDENQEALIDLYSELEEDTEKVENIKFYQLDLPEVINEINLY
jgi:hypothetical protein